MPKISFLQFLMIKKLSYLILFFTYYIKENLKTIKDIIGYFYKFKIINYFLFITNRNFNPFKEKFYQKFIKTNSEFWKNKNFEIRQNNRKILVTSLIHSHPAYSFGEAITGKYLSEYYKEELIGLVIKGDIPSEVTLRSFGIKKFIYLDKGSFVSRIKLFLKAYEVISKFSTVDEFLEYNFSNIEIGKAVYETFVRYTGEGTFEKLNFKFCYFLANAFHIHKTCEKIIKKYEITGVVQSETQFIPQAIIYQFFLANKIKVYARHGAGKKNSIRIFKSESEANTIRSEVSKKTFDQIYKNYKEIAIQRGEQHLTERFSGKTGYDDSGSVGIGHKNKKNFSKHELCSFFNWDEKKKIICIFGHCLIDGNFLSGWRIFRDNLTWLRKTLNHIKKIDDYNWLVKPHPMEVEYAKSKTDTIKEFYSIIGNVDNIKLVPKNISLNSLFQNLDLVVTCNGSAALECASIGKKSLMAGRSDFSDIIFNKEIPKNEEEYFSKLNDIDKITNISQEQIDKSKIYTYIQWKLNLVSNPFYPDNFEPNLFIDVDKFWDDAYKTIKQYNYVDDYYKKMIFHQLENDERHTSNLNELK